MSNSPLTPLGRSLTTILQAQGCEGYSPEMTPEHTLAKQKLFGIRELTAEELERRDSIRIVDQLHEYCRNGQLNYIQYIEWLFSDSNDFPALHPVGTFSAEWEALVRKHTPHLIHNLVSEPEAAYQPELSPVEYAKGQAAYNRYCGVVKTTYDGRPLPTYDREGVSQDRPMLTPLIRAGWAAAGDIKIKALYPLYPIEQIAEMCHCTNRNFCQSIGDHSQTSWLDAPDWQRDSAIKGVDFILDNPNAPASASHESWLKEKAETGWSYGPEKNAEFKTHPCFVPYEQLPQEQKTKDYLFGAVVRAMCRAEY